MKFDRIKRSQHVMNNEFNVMNKLYSKYWNDNSKKIIYFFKVISGQGNMKDKAVRVY